MKNSFNELNDHLFTQLERLAKHDMTEEQLLTEVTRSQAMVAVSNQIVGAANLQLKAVTLSAAHAGRVKAPSVLLEHQPIEDKPA